MVSTGDDLTGHRLLKCTAHSLVRYEYNSILEMRYYEEKRKSEAEQKGAQRKARAKVPPTELSCSDLYCSICNRQFRGRTGLISHLRTDQNRNLFSRKLLQFLVYQHAHIIITQGRNTNYIWLTTNKYNVNRR